MIIARLLVSGKTKPFKVLAYFLVIIFRISQISIKKDAIKQDPNGKFYQPFGQIYFHYPTQPMVAGKVIILINQSAIVASNVYGYVNTNALLA